MVTLMADDHSKNKEHNRLEKAEDTHENDKSSPNKDTTDNSSELISKLTEIKDSEEEFDKKIASILQNDQVDSKDDSIGITNSKKDAPGSDEKKEDKLASEEIDDADIGILLPKSSGFGSVKSRPPIKKNEDASADLIEKSSDKITDSFKVEDKKEETEKDTDEKTVSEAIIDLPEENKTETDDTTIEDSEKDTDKKLSIKDKIRELFRQAETEIDDYDPELHGPITEFKGVDGYEEVETYWVNEPYTFIAILYNEDINNHLYYVVEPELTDFETVLLDEIKDRLRDVLLVENINEKDYEKEQIIDAKIRSIIQDYTIEVTPAMLAKISYYIKRDFIRFGKIDALMYDDSIEDVSGNGHDIAIFLYHRVHQNIATNIVYGEDELNSFIIQMSQRSGKHISVAEPMIDATMPDGSRIQMTLGTSVTAHGSTFTIRKFSDTPITPVDLVKWGTFSAESMAYLWLCIENNKSLIYAGGTASGKTSSLNAVSLFIPEKSKVISLEDTRELKLPHPNWIPSLTRDSFTADERGAVDMYDLLKAALRQRPEFLLVGEVRGKEALTLFQAMSTGHTTFSTMHADSVASAIHRLENPPISVPRTMIQALDIMSIQSQTYSKGKRVRRNIKLVEIIDIDPNTRNIRTNDIFVWDSETDRFVRTGESKALFDIRMRRGWGQGQIDQELYYRQKVLEHMINNGISDFKEISDIINAYQSTPEKVLRKLGLA